MCPAERMQAGIFLMSTLPSFSSGSCETEKIVGSEIDVSGTFAFPGKNPCPVATVTDPWPCIPATLALLFFLCCSPCCSLHSSSSPRCSHSLTTKWVILQGLFYLSPQRPAQHDGRVRALGAERMESDPAPRLRGLPGCEVAVGMPAASPGPLAPRPQGDPRDRHGL